VKASPLEGVPVTERETRAVKKFYTCGTVVCPFAQFVGQYACQAADNQTFRRKVRRQTGEPTAFECTLGLVALSLAPPANLLAVALTNVKRPLQPDAERRRNFSQHIVIEKVFIYGIDLA
jgi:hypothetical protein